MEEYKIDSELFNSKYDRVDLVDMRREVSSEYLNFDYQTDYLYTPMLHLKSVFNKVKLDNKLPAVDFKYVYPEIDVKDLPETWGFTPEPKIADLVITLNRLGLATSSACEGHLDRAEPFPHVNFWNEEFYEVLAYLKDWEEIKNPAVKIRVAPIHPDELGQVFDLIFDTGDLVESQELAQRFSDYLKSKAR